MTIEGESFSELRDSFNRVSQLKPMKRIFVEIEDSEMDEIIKLNAFIPPYQLPEVMIYGTPRIIGAINIVSGLGWEAMLFFVKKEVQ